VKCPHCPRTFNENAAERHIPVCEKKAKLEMMKSKGGATKGIKASALA
jgi:hypothetical protein